jgi:hypothetical protein
MVWVAALRASARGGRRGFARASGFAAVAAALAFWGCADESGNDAPEITSVQQLAAVHLSPISIDYWDNYVGALQPQFGITPATALSEALQRSFITQNDIADLVSGQLQLGLPQSTKTVARTLGETGAASAATGTNAATGTQTGAGGTTGTGSTTTTRTTTDGSGTTATQTTTTQEGPGTLPPSLLPAASLPNAAALAAPGGGVQIDPLLTYRAATAIYQEVQLLDSYVRNAVQRYGYTAYVARVQVSVVPFVHDEPYDAYVDIGLFSRCPGSARGAREEPVLAIPLLVTDDVETGQATDAVNVARQLAASLGGTISNVALQAGLSRLHDQFANILGTAFNSLYMVSRAGDNVIQVRLGASRSPNLKTRYAMITQTHNVSFLMLVKKGDTPGTGKDTRFCRGSPQVRMTSLARFRNANTGVELQVDKDAILDRATAVMKRFIGEQQICRLSQDKKAYKAFLNNLLADIQEQDVDRFKQHYCAQAGTDACAYFDKGVGDSLWTGLTGVVTMSEYAGTDFELPRRPTPPVEGQQNQVVLLHDNCKDTLTATIPGFGSLTPSQFAATLTLAGKTLPGAPANQARPRIVLAATSISQPTVGGPFTVQFPSLKPLTGELGVRCTPAIENTPAAKKKSAASSDGSDGAASPGSAEALTGSLQLSPVGDNRWSGDGDGEESLSYSFPNLRYDGSPSGAPSVGLLAATDTLTADAAGKGSVRLFVTAHDVTEVDLAFAGAILTTPLPGNAIALQQPAAALKIAIGASGGTGPAVLDVYLQGLVANRAVTITATGKSTPAGQTMPQAVPGAAAVVALPVQAVAPPKANSATGGSQ